MLHSGDVKCATIYFHIAIWPVRTLSPDMVSVEASRLLAASSFGGVSSIWVEWILNGIGRPSYGQCVGHGARQAERAQGGRAAGAIDTPAILLVNCHVLSVTCDKLFAMADEGNTITMLLVITGSSANPVPDAEGNALPDAYQLLGKISSCAPSQSATVAYKHLISLVKVRCSCYM
jgi:hypothetical protein